MTAIAAVLGFVFAMMVGSGITQPVLRLLEGTREVEAGRLDKSIAVTTRDEIGQLSAAFNRMIERLRQNQRIRETFGRYIDPRIGDLTPDQMQLRTHYAEGLTTYRKRRREQARAAFAAALKAAPGDGPSIALLERMDDFAQNPPPETWDGSWRLEQK